jgi:hypothetical protein
MPAVTSGTASKPVIAALAVAALWAGGGRYGLAGLAVLLGLVPAVIAAGKGRNFFVWWLFGAVLVVVALPASLLVRDLTGSTVT